MNLITPRQDLSEEEYEKLVEGIKETVENDHSIPIICIPDDPINVKPRIIELKDRPSKHGTRLHKLSFEHDMGIAWDEVKQSLVMGRHIRLVTYEDIEDAVRGRKVWRRAERVKLEE